MRPRWRKFCNHYLISLNAADAARKAGYNHKQPELYGMRLLQKAPIKAYLADKIENVLGADFAGLKKRIVDELKKEAFDGDKNKIKALELLAKYAKLLDVSVNLNLGIRPEDKEALAFLQKHGLAERS